MTGEYGQYGEIGVSRRLWPAVVLLAALAPSVARAQVNIDEGKTPAHIFSSDCMVCHKSTRGLANGRAASDLVGFLSEHYTSSHQEAAAMAAYVLAGGGGDKTPPQTHAPKLSPDSPVAVGDEPKVPPGRQAKRQAKPGEEVPPGPKTKRLGEEPKTTAEATPPEGKRTEETPVEGRPVEAKPVEASGATAPPVAARGRPRSREAAIIPPAVMPSAPVAEAVPFGGPAGPVPPPPPADAPLGPRDNIPD